MILSLRHNAAGLKRFPEDFMFRLTEEEKAYVVANCDHLNKLKFSPYLPYAFTEHGAVMLASVLNSERAILVNIQVVRIFNKMREMLMLHKDVLLELEKIKREVLLRSSGAEQVWGMLLPPAAAGGYSHDATSVAYNL